MSEGKITRLASAAKELNVGTATIVEHLHSKGFKDVANSPNTKLTEEQYEILLREFRGDKDVKDKAEQINIGKRKEEELTIKEALKEMPKVVEKVEEEIIAVKHEVEGPKIVGKIDLDKPKKSKTEKKEEEKEEEVAKKSTKKSTEEVKEQIETKQESNVLQTEETVVIPEELVRAKIETLSGPKILGKIDLPIKADRRPEDIYRDEEKAKRAK